MSEEKHVRKCQNTDNGTIVHRCGLGLFENVSHNNKRDNCDDERVQKVHEKSFHYILCTRFLCGNMRGGLWKFLFFLDGFLQFL